MTTPHAAELLIRAIDAHGWRLCYGPTRPDASAPWVVMANERGHNLTRAGRGDGPVEALLDLADAIEVPHAD